MNVKQSKTALFLLVCLSLSSSALAQKQSFLFRLNASDQSCEKQLDQVADRLKAYPNLKVTNQECRGEVDFKADEISFKIRSFIIEFDSKKVLISYSATFGESYWVDSQPNDGHGVYHSFRECNESVASQSALFETATGLPALSAHCRKGSMQSSAGVVLEIKSLGKPKMSLFGFRSDYFTVGNAGVFEKFEEMIVAGGGIPLRFGNQFLYYAQKALPLRETSFARFQDPNHCLGQLLEAKKIASVLNAKQKLIGCYTQKSSSGRISTFLGVIWSGYTSHISSDHGLMSEKYLSFEECMSDLKRVKKVAILETPGLVGGICKKSDTQDVWVVELFSH